MAEGDVNVLTMKFHLGKFFGITFIRNSSSVAKTARPVDIIVWWSQPRFMHWVIAKMRKNSILQQKAGYDEAVAFRRKS